jgi:hypothetical protein
MGLFRVIVESFKIFKAWTLKWVFFWFFFFFLQFGLDLFILGYDSYDSRSNTWKQSAIKYNFERLSEHVHNIGWVGAESRVPHREHNNNI